MLRLSFSRTREDAVLTILRPGEDEGHGPACELPQLLYGVTLRRDYDDILPRNPWPGSPPSGRGDGPPRLPGRRRQQNVVPDGGKQTRSCEQALDGQATAGVQRPRALPSARDPVDTGEAVIICNGKVGSRARGVVAEAALGLVHKEDSHDGRDRGVHRSSRRPYLGARRRRSLLRRCDAIKGCGDEPSS
ncbi:uncharacterized protein L3040_000089 [Drepanopeziza brunnea f. sp. 'multigermtubi']|uniref:uncharacterized protein n=1 Tax=Drepanopeziza brunnea f. sp. 'multigermtubi' TaxID=698441 RepID=UPI002385EC64|nr:hypothetical protein L3040_000089 [Drepanopeziza brunnea f. sp. 'multigermtubi']